MKKYKIYPHLILAVVTVIYFPNIVNFLDRNGYHNTAYTITSIDDSVYNIAYALLSNIGVVPAKNTTASDYRPSGQNWTEKPAKPKMSEMQISEQYQENHLLEDKIMQDQSTKTCIANIEYQSRIMGRKMRNIDDYTFIDSSSTGWSFNIDGETIYIDLDNRQYSIDLNAADIFAKSNLAPGDAEKIKLSIIKHSLLDRAINSDKESKINMCKEGKLYESIDNAIDSFIDSAR